MKILKIGSYNVKNKNIYSHYKSSLINKTIKPQIDIFCQPLEIQNELVKKYFNLRDRLADKLYPVEKMCDITSWNLNINLTDTDLMISRFYTNQYTNIFKDKKTYIEFLKLKNAKLEKHEKKQLKDIINRFKKVLKYNNELNELGIIENDIAQKLNTYTFRIDGKEISKTEINKILESETNPNIRKKAYEAKIKNGDLIAKDLKKLVIKRNEFAKRRGYSNFFEYTLKEEYGVKQKELETLLNDIFAKSKNLISKNLKETQTKLSKAFGIKEEHLKNYHYGLLTKNNPEKFINDNIKTKEQIVNIAKKTYSAMGFDINKLEDEGKLILDLFPKKGKNTHGFCFGIDAGKDARILANLTNDAASLEILNHELGHAVYTLGISRKLPYFDRFEYPAISEAIAMMMGDLQQKENILADVLPKNVLEKYKKEFITNQIAFIARSIKIINFEKEMYKNPNQDLGKLWHNMKVKYEMRSDKEFINNEWATIPHFLTLPVYYQNYFRATIMKFQIYNYLVSKLGNITENNKTAEILNNRLFKYGKSLEENELIKVLTNKSITEK